MDRITANDFDTSRWAARLGTAIDRAASEADGVSEPCRRGNVTLAFRVAADGRITDIRVVFGSGDAGLDRRAIAKLRRAEPLPAGPAGAAPRTHMVAVRIAEPIRAARGVAARQFAEA